MKESGVRIQKTGGRNNQYGLSSKHQIRHRLFDTMTQRPYDAMTNKIQEAREEKLKPEKTGEQQQILDTLGTSYGQGLKV